MNNYVLHHLHDDTSNCNGYADSCSSYKEYIKLAKKQGMSSLGFSNHGGIFDWIKKKQDCDKAGIKYIHGVELNLCTKLETDERGYHICLYAKNLDGVKELNKLISISTSKGKNEDKTDRHFYYHPRISIQELMDTSNNIIVTTACLASILWQKKDDKDGVVESLLQWLSDNKHRCFLEIQYHNCEHQITYNKLLYNWSKEYGIPLIAGTDTHSSSKYKAECRKILQISKDSFYGEEDEFDLIWKTYDELVECFKIQNALPKEIYMQAIHNTNVLADMVEDFKLDKSFKYPNLYGKDALDIWKKTILNKLRNKHNNKIIDMTKIEEYKQKIKEEFEAMKKQGMESFMMFMSELVDFCNNNGIPYGFCRGSVGGSEIAYITDITDVDPVKWNTVFSRFCNADRISLADIDIDFAPEDREKVYKFIIDRFTPEKTAYIAAFTTLRDRGTIDVLAKGLNYHDLDLVMDIKNKFDKLYEDYSKIIQEEVNLEELEELESTTIDFDNHDIYCQRIRNKKALTRANNLIKDFENLKSENKDLFYYFDGIKGTIIAKGNHPAGIIGSPITLADNLGVFYKDGDESQPISVCAMKAVDSVNFVKFDILGLKTVGIIKDVYKYINSHYLKSHEIDWNDKNVWDNMITSNVGVFQFEGDYAFALLKEFQPKFINDMSLVNAALRPSGKSYRDRLIKREFNENPSEQIDELLNANHGFLVYQEDTIKFLTDICGFSGSLADTTRRCVDEDTLITMGNGDLKKIKDITINDRVMSVNSYGISESKPVNNVFNNGIRDTYKVTTIHGKELIATSDHKVFTQDGYKCISDLNTEDSIMSLRKINSDKDTMRPNERLSCQEMFLIGMLIGDGTIYSISRTGEANNRPSFTNSEMVLIEKFKECIISRIRTYGKPINCDFQINSQNGIDVDKIYNIRIDTPSSNNALVRLLDKYDLRHHAANKKLHDEFMSYPIGEKLQNLLGGLFSTDGGCYNHYIEYCTISEALANQIQYLLLKYNIYSYIVKKFVPDYSYYLYRVWIGQVESFINFRKYILPFVVGNKQNKYNKIIENSVNNDVKFNYLLPNKCKNEVRDNMIVFNKSFNDIGLNLGYEENNFNIHSTEFGISDIKAKEISKELYIPYTYWLLNTDYIPLRVKSIEYVGKSNVYDIEVYENHNYIANGLVVHNCIGKKDVDGLNEQLPKIIDGYCKKSNKSREIAEEEVKQFIQIISDSSEYQFGYNHSTGYSMNGYVETRLRTYYPLEFVTAYLNRADNTEDTNMGVDLANQLGIKIKPISFGKSVAEYTFDKKENCVYKGIASIKYLNSQVPNELYELSRQKEYTEFIDLLQDIKEKTSTDARQLRILTGLNFFRQFGKNKRLLEIIDIYDNLASRKQINFKDIDKLNINEELLKKYSSKTTATLYKELDMMGYIIEVIKNIEDKPLSIKEEVKFQMDYLEYCEYINKKAGDKFYIVMGFKTYKDTRKPYLTLRQINSGNEIKTKIKEAKVFVENPFKLYDVLKVTEFKQQYKTKCIGGEWRKTDELEDILYKYEVY